MKLLKHIFVKHFVLTFFVLAVCVLGSYSFFLQNKINAQIAYTITTYTGTGNTPQSIAFDGTNMWTANFYGSSVSKITPSGTITTYSGIGTGNYPTGIAFDGTNMWTTNRREDWGTSTISKITPSGTITNYTRTGGLSSGGIAFDGTNMWTANPGDNSVSKITSAGEITTYSAGLGGGPLGITFDGTNMWTANTGDNSVSKITSTGVITTYYDDFNNSPLDITFDGTNLWTVNDGGSVYKISLTGTVIATYADSLTYRFGVISAGTNVWTANHDSNSVSRITSSGSITTYSIAGANTVEALAYDDTNIWTANTGNNSVSKIAPVPSGSGCTQNCTPPPPSVDGVCGIANGTLVYAPPTQNLCSVGTSTEPYPQGASFLWYCLGVNGGNQPQCSANLLPPPPPPPIPFRFSIVPSTTTVFVFGGQQTTTTINLNHISGTSGAVYLSSQTIEPTITQIFSPTSCIPPCSSTLILRTTNFTPKSDIGIPYQIFIFGSSTNFLNSSYFTLKVRTILSDIKKATSTPPDTSPTSDIIIIPTSTSTPTSTIVVITPTSTPTSTISVTPPSTTTEVITSTTTETVPVGDISSTTPIKPDELEIPSLISIIKNIPPFVKNVIKTISIAGAIAIPTITATASLLLNSIALKDILLLPLRLWGSLLTFLGIRKRARIWGTVYDSVTKQPLDPALVTLKRLDGGTVIEAITDLDGRYGFLVEPGTYLIFAEKTDYKYPSEKLKGNTSDELYQDLHFSEPITIIKSGEVIAKNIPMDSTKFSWNEFVKNEKKLTKFYHKRDLILSRFSSALFALGAMSSLYLTITDSTIFNISLLSVYVLIYILKKTKIIRPSPKGIVVTKVDNIPLSFAIIKVFSAATDTLIIKKTTNKIGKYFLLVPNGKYYLTIEKKNPDESYTEIFRADSFKVKNGAIDRKWVV